jgi:hypothetical protein
MREKATRKVARAVQGAAVAHKDKIQVFASNLIYENPIMMQQVQNSVVKTGEREERSGGERE